MDDLFAPPGEAWQRLAPRYATARRVSAAVTNLMLTLVASVTVGLLLDWTWAAITGAAGVAWTAYRVVRAGRWARAFGYAERAEDLLLTQGLLRRQLTAIPYSRMQSVKVESGPIDRAWGLSTVSLVTASVQSQASIPGLTEADAVRLRDRLIEAGEEQAAPL